MKRLLLFDIDSTLICSKGIWGKCFLEALQEVFPHIQKPQNVSFAGKTDLQICREILMYSNIPLIELEKKCDFILQRYEGKAHKAAQQYADKVEILPGVITLLQRLKQQKNITLTLLTGNIFVGAKIKLCCKNLDAFFDFEIGAWGDDNWDRHKLPAIAVSRAQKKLGISFSGKEVVIIGDTIHDVNCGKSLGVRSIAVGTGKQDKNVLLGENPDFYFDNLEDDKAFLEAINRVM
ncbi:HAD family hydrolase [Candidatus Uabimicrobium amorphum]|uniref:phosphoglycolate phosphatase n=1 Tax=Uabimicrobium amorphum TaxID=2596890 RepID=A0A5S9F5C2_UABAM|nr:HAD hydrolase-like protein [Candidatus Uabimicrobium amorphum]BBM85122.1 hydrolase [Candidatus Uabimicrobium amorphum]